jgi:hypothetical protein
MRTSAAAPNGDGPKDTDVEVRSVQIGRRAFAFMVSSAMKVLSRTFAYLFEQKYCFPWLLAIRRATDYEWQPQICRTRSDGREMGGEAVADRSKLEIVSMHCHPWDKKLTSISNMIDAVSMKHISRDQCLIHLVATELRRCVKTRSERPVN